MWNESRLVLPRERLRYPSLVTFNANLVNVNQAIYQVDRWPDWFIGLLLLSSLRRGSNDVFLDKTSQFLLYPPFEYTYKFDYIVKLSDLTDFRLVWISTWFQNLEVSSFPFPKGMKIPKIKTRFTLTIISIKKHGIHKNLNSFIFEPKEIPYTYTFRKIPIRGEKQPHHFHNYPRKWRITGERSARKRSCHDEASRWARWDKSRTGSE